MRAAPGVPITIWDAATDGEPPNVNGRLMGLRVTHAYCLAPMIYLRFHGGTAVKVQCHDISEEQGCLEVHFGQIPDDDLPRMEAETTAANADGIDVLIGTTFTGTDHNFFTFGEWALELKPHEIAVLGREQPTVN